MANIVCRAAVLSALAVMSVMNAANAEDVSGFYRRVQLDPDYICPGRSAPASIEIAQAPHGKYRITGLALWVQNVPEPSPHTGEIDFTGTMKENMIHLMNRSSYPVDIKITFSKDRLTVSDAGNTGGLNVTFTGVYMRDSEREGITEPETEGITCR